MGMKKIFVDVFMLICIILFLFSAWKLWGIYQEYKEARKEYEQLREYIQSSDETDSGLSDGLGEGGEKGGDASEQSAPIRVDFDKLRELNPEIVGWIYIAGTSINYPVLQTEDNDYYLHHTYERKENRSGAIFMDCHCDRRGDSQNTILYGHNMKDGSMFGSLKKMYDIDYNAQADFRQHPFIWLITPTGATEYEIYACREINLQEKEDREVYLVDAGSEEEYQSYLNLQKSKAQYDTGVSPQASRKMLTLSTCTSGTRDGRFVVQAIER